MSHHYGEAFPVNRYAGSGVAVAVQTSPMDATPRAASHDEEHSRRGSVGYDTRDDEVQAGHGFVGHHADGDDGNSDYGASGHDDQHHGHEDADEYNHDYDHAK